jgi:predicted amidophosphoribosyltransferase
VHTAGALQADDSDKGDGPQRAGAFGVGTACPSCGEDWEPDEGECYECGYTRDEETCPNCGEEWNPDEGECHECGYTRDDY